MDFIKECTENKVVAIIRGVDESKVSDLATALYNGGIRMIEVAFVHSSAEGIANTEKCIEKLVNTMQGKMHIGAGTVLSAEQVQKVFDLGAEFIITPNINADVITKSKELGMGCMPGGYTATEIEYAYRLGADIVKVFPAKDAGPGYIKNLLGPLSHIPLACVGGIGADNVREFLDAGCCCAGIGGSLVDKKAVEAGDFEKITAAAEDVMRKCCDR